MAPSMLLPGNPRVDRFQLSTSFSRLRHTSQEQQLLKLKDTEWAPKAPCFTPGFFFLSPWDRAKFHSTLTPVPSARLSLPQWVCVTVASSDDPQKFLGSWLCWSKAGILCHRDCNQRSFNWCVFFMIVGGQNRPQPAFQALSWPHPVSISFSAALFQACECLCTLFSLPGMCTPTASSVKHLLTRSLFLRVVSWQSCIGLQSSGGLL